MYVFLITDAALFIWVGNAVVFFFNHYLDKEDKEKSFLDYFYGFPIYGLTYFVINITIRLFDQSLYYGIVFAFVLLVSIFSGIGYIVPKIILLCL